MALLPILQYPDPRLRIKAKPVLAVDKSIQTLIADMLETMYDAQGIGLAATQVDVHQRLIVIDISKERNQPLVLINPELVSASAQLCCHEEGCLSLPGIYDSVQRPQAVTLQVLDQAGQSRLIEADGLLAVCVQHEMDHLLGKLFIDYLSVLKRNRIKTKLLKAQRENRTAQLV